MRKRKKSVKKNAALLHFLGFFSLTLLFGVPRASSPLPGLWVAQHQSPSGALNRTSGPALLDGGHRFGRQARCLGTARLFSFPFLVTKKESLAGESHDKRPCRKVGRAGQAQTINLYFSPRQALSASLRRPSKAWPGSPRRRQIFSAGHRRCGPAFPVCPAGRCR